MADLTRRSQSLSLWDDPETAKKILQEKETLEKKVNRLLKIEKRFDDLVALVELAELEDDLEVEKEAEQELASLVAKAHRYQLEALLSGDEDENDCFLEIQAGAGGTEAQDWAQMLARMYSRWVEQQNYQLEILDENPGEEAGVKSIAFKVKGYQAYGWLKTEAGVHRLVRISPFDSNARRHTSFASVSVYPVLDDSITIEIESKDLRIDTYRASGAGGQHVNKTESAIRITHLPSGIVVQCQSDRSQHRNRAQAMTMLKARLYEKEKRERDEKASSTTTHKGEIGWGNQIRSYVLQPYQMVKDLRTNVEKGNAQAVLNGDINDFLEASLAQGIEKKT